MTENQIKISIIMPAYNCETTIEKAIESILSQTLKEIELIVIDDCSTDTTLDLVKKYAEKDTRIRYYVQEKNAGPGNAKNRGIRLAQGEYLGFCDADDWIEADMYENMYSSIFGNNCGVSVCGYSQDVYNEENLLVRSNEVIYKTISYDGAAEVSKGIAILDMKKQFSFSWNKIYERKILMEYNIVFSEKKFGEDFDFNADFFRYVNGMAVIGSAFYHYRKGNKDSLTEKFIPDYYEIITDRYQRMKSLLKYRNAYNRKIREIIAAVYLKHVLASFVHNCDRAGGYTMKMRRKFIADAFTSPVLKEAVREAKSYDRASQIYNHILRTENVTLNLIFARIVYFTQKRMQGVFDRLKRI